MSVDTKVNLGGLEMATPVAVASGTFGYGAEYVGAVDYSKLGAGKLWVPSTCASDLR